MMHVEFKAMKDLFEVYGGFISYVLMKSDDYNIENRTPVACVNDIHLQWMLYPGKSVRKYNWNEHWRHFMEKVGTYVIFHTSVKYNM